jgi:hypothetical protein
MMLHSSGLRRWLICVLLALVSLQTLTVVHRIVHQESVAQGVTHQQLEQNGGLHTQSNSLKHSSEIAKFFAGLWGEHKSLTDCELFDQACPDVLQHALFIDSYISPPVTWMGAVLLERFALVERFYAARGPPVFALI